MKQKAKKIFIFGLIFAISTFVIGLIILSGLYIFSNKVEFDINKIKYSNVNIQIYDNKNCPIKNSINGSNYIKLEMLSDNTKNAFISIEDKNFYSHNGLNYKRMAKAMLKNIKSLKFKEGASTISQQLIKNTHLTNQKTITRKLNEIALTKKLEKTLTKNEILEYYLNIIYFGDNCYGIENASQHYFSKSAKDLNLTEGATLAGMIKSPNTFSPIKNIEKTTNRRNIVLLQMLNDNKISFDEYVKAKQTKIKTNITPVSVNNINSYYNACLDEACDILKMPAKQIAIGEYKIYSNMNKFKQENLEKSISAFKNDNDSLAISINANDGKIEAYYGNSNLKLYQIKRQPGSAIKPIIVYSPALNENIISPITQINDEQIDINGYSPNNVNNVNYGYISVRECVKKSLNIPAVKIMSYVGVNKAKSYANKCNIQFDKNDENLSLALGGMTYGISLKDLTNAYSVFTNKGEFVEAKFIDYITDKNGKIIYHYTPQNKKVFREDTASLMTNMLIDCAKSGTARKIGSLNIEVASKTGTVGNTVNTDAYNISYTTEDIVGVWNGNLSNAEINTVGGGIPTDIMKYYLSNIYETKKPKNFETPTSVYEEFIDNLSLSNEHIVYKANCFVPPKYIIKEKFSRFNPPKEKITNSISIKSPNLYGTIENNKAKISFETKDYLIYELYKIENDKEELICAIQNKNGIFEQNFNIDKKTKYFVITKIKNYENNSEIICDKSNVIELLPNSITLQKYSNIKKEKWYI